MLLGFVEGVFRFQEGIWTDFDFFVCRRSLSLKCPMCPAPLDVVNLTFPGCQPRRCQQPWSCSYHFRNHFLTVCTEAVSFPS